MHTNTVQASSRFSVVASSVLPVLGPVKKWGVEETFQGYTVACCKFVNEVVHQSIPIHVQSIHSIHTHSLAVLKYYT